MKTFQNPPPLLLPLLLRRSATTARPGGIRSPLVRPDMDTHRLSACRPHGLCFTLTPVLRQQFLDAWPLASEEGWSHTEGPKNKTTALIFDEVFDKLKVPLAKWWAVIDLQWKPETEFYQNEWQKHGQIGLWGEGDKATEAFLNDE